MYGTVFEKFGKMSKTATGVILGEPGGPSVDSRRTKMFWQVDLMP